MEMLQYWKTSIRERLKSEYGSGSALHAVTPNKLRILNRARAHASRSELLYENQIIQHGSENCKAPWVFCPGAEVIAKDGRGEMFLATFVVAETMVHDGQTVYTGYYVRKGIDGRVVFVSIGRLQSLHVNCLECPERNAWTEGVAQRLLGLRLLVHHFTTYTLWTILLGVVAVMEILFL
ncbi:hypothetical protein BDN70DRAFT_900667 [Pholiota conissans]|uniref:Uncharacterized protein n=1 Tax=Pholiota conissans TaxID=109636 RepID=A0A9P6CTN2_9AGAR|nr:hypothetical protein BDN70DRAFT_900667 [Pholiota conissans]